MQSEDVKSVLWPVIEEAVSRGSGFAQQSVVLRQAADKLGITGDLDEEQILLTVWHDLFRGGELVWGFNCR